MAPWKSRDFGSLHSTSPRGRSLPRHETEVLHAWYPFHHRNVRKAGSAGLRYSELAIFTISSRTFVSKTGSLMVNNAVTTGTTLGTALLCTENLLLYPPLPTSMQCRQKRKGQIMPHVMVKITSACVSPERGWGSPESADLILKTAPHPERKGAPGRDFGLFCSLLYQASVPRTMLSI